LPLEYLSLAIIRIMYILNGKKTINFFINSDKADMTDFFKKNPVNHIINIFIK